MNYNDKFDCCKFCENNTTDKQKCIKCDGNNNFQNQTIYLKRHVVIKNQYVIDKVIFVNSEGVTYIAYDKITNQQYFVREYMPQNIAVRVADNNYILPIKNKEAQYKALMVDFIDLNKTLFKISNIPGIIPIKNIWAENNTVYVIKEYLNIISLRQYLDMKPNRCLSWYKCKPILMKLNDMLIQIHSAGIIHRGISPYNIYLDRQNKIYIDGFCISCVRTANSELMGELYKGYSAPEQYQTNGWQDTWTDVFGVAATLYNILTGETINFNNKNELKNKEMMPNEVMIAIINATEPNYKKRTQTIYKFNSELLDEIFDSRTAVYDVDNLRSIKSLKSGKRRSYMKKYIIIITVLILFVILSVMGINLLKTLRGNTSTQKIDDEYIEKNSWLFDEVTSQNSLDNENNLGDSQTKSTTEAIIKTLPNFVGEQLNYIKNNKSYIKKLNLIIEEQFSEAPKGEVIHQEPSPGMSIKNNKLDVILTVSKGPEYIEVPDLINKSISEAETILKSLKIKYEIVEVYDKSYKKDVINFMSKNPGDKIIKNKEILVLRVKSSQLDNSPSNVSPAIDSQENAQSVSESSFSSTNEVPTE